MTKLFTDLHTFPPAFLPPLAEHNPSFIYVDSVAECDYILLPHWEVIYEYTEQQYKSRNLDPGLKNKIQQSVQNLVALSATSKKQMIVIHWSDSDEDIALDNALIFRTSLYKSSQKPNVFAYPSWSGDFQADYLNNVPLIRAKKEKPSVGFRGSAVPLGFSVENIIRSQINVFNSWGRKIKFPYRLPFGWTQGQVLRKKAVQRLMANPAVDTDFTILTRGYINQKSAAKKEQNRQLFVNNILGNDYILCVRGAGNYSFRLYETLSAGRIPLIINTDCVLPFDFLIDWKKYCVWVEEKDIDRVDEILLQFHHSLSNDDFKQLQINIRSLWDEWISPQGFFKNFDKHFSTQPVLKEAVSSV